MGLPIGIALANIGLNRVFLLNINPLYIKKPKENYWTRFDRLPLFCQVSFDDKLVNEIQICRELLVTYGLSTVSKRCQSVTCFFEITESFHPDVSLDLHVTEQSLYFTGFIRPYEKPYFQTVSIPISVAIDSSKELKRITLPQKEQQDQSALIRLIDTKTDQLNLLLDAIHELDALKNQLVKVNRVGCDLSTADFFDYHEKIQGNIACKELQTDDLQTEIDDLCKQLLWRYFSILPGDWIYSYEGRVNRAPSQLIYESASYQSGAVFVTGQNITQKGEVGKRVDSIVIRLKNDEHIR